MKFCVIKELQKLIRFHSASWESAWFVLTLVLSPVAAFGGGVVTNCTEADLRAAMAGGGLVTFACDGTITLTSTITNDLDLTLDATGHQVTISGGNSVRAFFVSTNVNFSVVNLKIANCWAMPAEGAGIFNNFGTLRLAYVVFQTNRAGFGGAICNHGGELNATNCTFDFNGANQISPAARGGAIYNDLLGGAVNLQQCLFTNNQAIGVGGMPGTAGLGAAGYGGAIHNAGSLVADSCSFLGNSAGGGNGLVGNSGGFGGGRPGDSGKNGGEAGGGAICNNGSLMASRCLFGANSASGGSGGNGGDGGTGTGNGGTGGAGGNGASAYGGGLYDQSSGTLINCTFAANTIRAGGGGSGGAGGRAGMGRGGDGGAGGNGGQSALGGAISGETTIVNCTVALNSANPGLAGVGGGGGFGPTTNGVAGAPGTNGLAYGGGVRGATLVNTLLATNSPGGNCGGGIDGGHNLSSDGTCDFTSGSMNNTDPQLGPLTNNGGPTLTMALLPGSPAIDAGDGAALLFADQRGFPRPAGTAADIGAYEFGSVMPTVGIARAGGLNLNIVGYGNTGQVCRLLASTNLLHWVSLATNHIGSNGNALFNDTCGTGACRYYRLVMP